MISKLAIQAAATYGFRPQGAKEPDDAYRAALIPYLEVRDWAAAYEVRLDRPQAEWTPAETQAFADHILSHKRPPAMEFDPGLHAFVVGELPSVGPASLDALIALAECALRSVTATRAERPTAEIPILCTALLMDGRSLSTATDPGRRLAFLNAVIRHAPVFGYIVATDAFLHLIDKITGTASKRDGFIVHLGTHDGARQMWQVPYRIEDGRVLFAPRVVLAGEEFRKGCGHDPYAELFVSVPPSGSVS